MLKNSLSDTIDAEMTCPCGSDHPLTGCCLPFIQGSAIPETAEQVMRSRYTGYAIANHDYIVATWHPTTRVPDLKQRLSEEDGPVEWQSLRVLSHQPGQAPNESFVTFFARYLSPTGAEWIYETSRFLYENNRWYYSDGIHKIPGRNELCPCGSEKKFKKCCAQ